MEKYFESLGLRLRELRKSKNLTMEQLSERIKKSHNFLGNIERGESVPSLKTLIALANELEVSADVLLQDYLNVYADEYLTTTQKRLNPNDNDFSESEKKLIREMIKLMKQFKNS